MSGEAVVVAVPVAAVAVAGPVLLAGAAIAGTALIGALAIKGVAAGVGAVIEQQAREARRRAEEERVRLLEWQAFERRQHQAMAEAQARHGAIAQMQQRLMAVQLREPSLQPASHGSTRAEGYRSLEPERAAQRSAIAEALAEVAAVLDAVPAELRQHTASPIASLQLQVQHAARRVRDAQQSLPDDAQITALQRTAEQSIAAFLARLAAERDERARRVERADAALQRLLVLEQLSLPNRLALDAPRSTLLEALKQGEVNAATLEQVEESLEQLSQQAAESLATAAVRPALADALLRHLGELGYEVLTAFPSRLDSAKNHAQVRIPGGDQVAIEMDADARLRFRLQHERAAADDAPMSRQEMAFARAQEQRWCKDLKTVVNRLVEDGFDSRVSFERNSVEIPIVVFERFEDDETASAESASAQDREAEERRRKLRQMQQRKDTQRKRP